MGSYDVMQVCLNGHVITSTARSSPELRKNFCSRCGAATIAECPGCQSFIRGRYQVSGIVDLTPGPSTPPAFCHACGKPYPWTEAALEAARELIDLEDNISAKEREALKADLSALLTNTPRTQIAATKFKLFIAKAGKPVADALYQFIIDFASETAKKLLGMP